MTLLRNAPTRIETPRLRLRPFHAADADALTTLVTASIDHLTPWQPWAADEPVSIEQRREAIDTLAAQFAAGEAAHYAVVRRDDGRLLGSVALVTGKTPERVEIGYWVGASHVRRGYASEAAGALTQAALGPMGLPCVELWANADNEASNAVARRMGFTFVGVEPSYAQQGSPPMRVWVAEPDLLDEEILLPTQLWMFAADGTELTGPPETG
ncbi:GNAT family N-acetyltransferase [Demequina muriae]|uniref:GNAT family protein n=1 Tax=Demequina muriae TaxID=3051664 RepID=A0ABT8GF39_9MICO|nr:GNAT family protein [Demequina sp. EGI L300058]MDN4479566.1 GNAT family protein [Demequina sp. EGI L300058]